MTNRMLSFGIVAVGLLVAGGCGGGTQEKVAATGGERDAAAEWSWDKESGAIKLPMTVYEHYEDNRVVAHALELQARECMAAKGQEFEVFDERGLPPDPLIAYSTRAIGLTSMGDAEKYGYELPPGKLEDIRKERSQSNTPGTDEYLAAAEKCSAEDPTVRTPELGFDSSIAWSNANDNPKVKSVLKAWNDCVVKAGYQASPDLPAGLSEQGESGTEAEIIAAVTDVECKLKVGYVPTYLQALADEQQKLIDDRKQELAAFTKAWDQAVADAESYIESKGG